MITTEYRIIVKGWKIEQESPSSLKMVRREFTSYHSDPARSSINYMRSRIGANVLDDWQPHITEVILEQREVTEWREFTGVL